MIYIHFNPYCLPHFITWLCMQHSRYHNNMLHFRVNNFPIQGVYQCSNYLKLLHILTVSENMEVALYNSIGVFKISSNGLK